MTSTVEPRHAPAIIFGTDGILVLLVALWSDSSAIRTLAFAALLVLGLALHGFHDANKGFPPALQDTPHHGWTPFILPSASRTSR